MRGVIKPLIAGFSGYTLKVNKIARKLPEQATSISTTNTDCGEYNRTGRIILRILLLSSLFYSITQPAQALPFHGKFTTANQLSIEPIDEHSDLISPSTSEEGIENFHRFNPLLGWSERSEKIFEQIGKSQISSSYGCYPQITVIDNPLPVAQISTCDSITFSNGLLELVHDRSELAFIIAHEMAHQLLGHLHEHHDDKSSSHHHHHWSAHEELEADKLALSLMEHGGFDETKASVLLTRLGDFGKDFGIRLADVHPTLDARRDRVNSILIQR